MVLALLALSFLIFVHEAGHYVVARWCGMRVERFSIGFGPAIFKVKNKSGTQFQVTPIPFGGFVEIRGMNIAEEVDPDDAQAYANRPVSLRFATILAGPATNWISAIALALLLYAVFGVKTQERWFGVGAISDDAAAKGVLESGDRVLAIDGEPIYLVSPEGKVTAGALPTKISDKQGAPVTIMVKRKGAIRDVTITPKLGKNEDGTLAKDASGRQIYRLGFRIEEQFDRVHVSAGSTLARAFRYPVDQSAAILSGLYQVVTGAAKAELGGPVRIVEEFNAAFESSFVDGLELLMVLSVYLALINLFPLPALDGGRLVFLGYEMITRRRANPKIETTVHMAGVLLLMVVMVMVTYKDVARLF
ncbi:MAG: M50 family metallopeptidase [Kofleriaceae bacterium]